MISDVKETVGTSIRLAGYTRISAFSIDRADRAHYRISNCLSIGTA
jgi:hypothetical protein